MNVIRFITRSLGFSGEQKEEDLLNDTYVKFIEGDEISQMNSLNKLLRFSFNSNDMSFLGFQVTMLLSCPSVAARIVGFKASTIFLSRNSPYTEMLPAIYRKAMKDEELVSHALYSCSYLVTPFVFQSIERDLSEILNTGRDIERKLALHVVFNTYKQDFNVIKKLIPLLRSALFQPSLKYTAYNMLCELCNNAPKDVFPLLDTIISEIPVANPFLFSKISRILIAMIKINPEISQALEKPVQVFLGKQSTCLALIDVALLVSNGNFSSTLYTQIGSKIQNTLSADSTDPNVTSSLLYALERITGKFKPNPSVIAQFVESPDNAIRGPAITIKYTYSSKDNRSTVDLYRFVATSKDPVSAKELLNVSKKEGKIFISMLLSLYDLKIPGIENDICNSILSIKDKETQTLFLQEVHESIFEPPDDPVGITICHAIAEWSDDPEDIKILIPPTLAKRSEEYQASLITDATSFWLRLQFEIENGVLNRIQVLTQSPHIEVRTCAKQMLDLIDN